MNEDKIYITYVRDRKNFPVACVASRAKSISAVEGEMWRIDYAVSSYNPIDPFNKKLAREIATERLKKHPRGQFTVSGGEESVKFLLMDSLYRDSEIPSNTRKAARQWLAEWYATTSETPVSKAVGDDEGQGQEESAS